MSVISAAKSQGFYVKRFMRAEAERDKALREVKRLRAQVKRLKQQLDEGPGHISASRVAGLFHGKRQH